MSKVHKLRDLFAQLDSLYAELPQIACTGKCHVSCACIPLSVGEAKRLQVTTHHKPRTTADLVCTYLTIDKRCSAYAARPLVCRAYGLCKSISCPHGCIPDRWLDERDFIRIAQAVERISGELLITGPEGLASAGQDFASFGQQLQDVSDDAERTRNLRALHGGRIMAVRGSEQSPGPPNWVNAGKKKP